MGKAWIIASGKGGVGKSTVTAALGAALSQRGCRCCIVDADIGLRDQDVILGVENRVVYDLLDVLEKRCRMD
ncbi:MAG: P-loop NTPase [Clostridia bacterium]|nr:P-loop NTPase [Clostridia bacterium]